MQHSAGGKPDDREQAAVRPCDLGTKERKVGQRRVAAVGVGGGVADVQGKRLQVCLRHRAEVQR